MMNRNGHQSLSNMNASVSKAFFDFEKNFDKHEYKAWMNKYWSVSIYMGIIYVILIFTGQAMMRSKPAFQLRKFLIAWNICLAIFSFLGALRTFPELFYVLKNEGVHCAICSRSYVEDNQVSGVWGWLFAISKGPELVDTAFVILRKQELLFLHWYHHLTTVIYSWAIYSDHPSIARTHIFMNYAVHAVMYFYYFLRAMKIKTPRAFAMFITTSQIVQLFLGTGVAVYALIMKITGKECGVSDNVVLASNLIYFTLMVLFVKFFHCNYFGTRKVRVVHEKAA